MSNKQRVYALAAKLGATVEYDMTEPHVYVDAPAGYCWSCDPGLHGIVGVPWDDETMADVWKDVLERVRFGIEKCNCGQCPDIGEEVKA